MAKDKLKSVASALVYQKTVGLDNQMERPKTYEEGLRDGFLKGQEEANKLLEQMLHTTCNHIVCELPETEVIKLLKDKLNKAKEIISKYYNYTSPSSKYFYTDINEEAKQFLEENEND